MTEQTICPGCGQVPNGSGETGACSATFSGNGYIHQTLEGGIFGDNNCPGPPVCPGCNRVPDAGDETGRWKKVLSSPNLYRHQNTRGGLHGCPGPPEPEAPAAEEDEPGPIFLEEEVCRFATVEEEKVEPLSDEEIGDEEMLLERWAAQPDEVRDKYFPAFIPRLRRVLATIRALQETLDSERHTWSRKIGNEQGRAEKANRNANARTQDVITLKNKLEKAERERDEAFGNHGELILSVRRMCEENDKQLAAVRKAALDAIAVGEGNVECAACGFSGQEVEHQEQNCSLIAALFRPNPAEGKVLVDAKQFAAAEDAAANNWTDTCQQRAEITRLRARVEVLESSRQNFVHIVRQYVDSGHMQGPFAAMVNGLRFEEAALAGEEKLDG